MIRVLTDQPDAAEPILGSAMEWQPVHAGSPPEISALAACLNPGRPVWIATCQTWRDDAEGYLVIIDEAPRSQFDAVLEAARTPGLPDEPVVAIALTGTRFRGQRERPWTALRGNLHLTARYRIDVDAAACAPALTMAPAVAAAEAIHALGSPALQPRIKWVNDVLVGGGKVAGVLTALQRDGARVHHALFGIGMNIDAAPDLPVLPGHPRPTCLADRDAHCRGALPRILHVLTGQLDTLVRSIAAGDGDAVYARYRARAAFIGATVAIWPEHISDPGTALPLHRGRVLDVLPDLALVLDTHPEPVRGGRMIIERPAPGD
jgi:biotin-(acetyl-CoA carboxylase) ligase